MGVSHVAVDISRLSLPLLTNKIDNEIFILGLGHPFADNTDCYCNITIIGNNWRETIEVRLSI